MLYSRNVLQRIKWSLLSTVLALSATACATRSVPTLPAVVEPVKIPSPPAGIEPKPSGHYLTRHCALVKKVQETVSSARPASGPC